MEYPRRIIRLILKAVALALAVATVVIGSQDGATVDTLVALLGIGLFALAVAAMQSEEAPIEDKN